MTLSQYEKCPAPGQPQDFRTGISLRQFFEKEPTEASERVSVIENSLEKPLRELLPIVQRRILGATYFGVPALKNPIDFWIYQEMIFALKPAVIISLK
jgi:hypothetical protein